MFKLDGDFIQNCITLVGILGILITGYYGLRQKTTILTLKESNEAYFERNRQLDETIEEMKLNHTKEISEMKGRIDTLSRIKTPPLAPLMRMVHENHVEVMKALGKEVES